VTLDHTSLEFQDNNVITNLVYVMSSTDKPQDWFKRFDRTTLQHLTIRGNFTRPQISSPILGTNLQDSLKTLTFKDPHFCKEFQFNSSEMCTETFEFKKLKKMEFLGIESECTELFDFFSQCVKFPKGCTIRILHSTRLKLSQRRLNRLSAETGCEVLAVPILL